MIIKKFTKIGDQSYYYSNDDMILLYKNNMDSYISLTKDELIKCFKTILRKDKLERITSNIQNTIL